MQFRQLDDVSQPLRWLAAWSAIWSAVTSASIWTRAESPAARIGPVSADWLQDFERRSIRTRDL